MLMSFTHYAIVHIYGVSILSRFYLKKKKKTEKVLSFLREKANFP